MVKNYAKIYLPVLLVGLLVFFAKTALAQTCQADLLVTIRTHSGAALPGVKFTVFEQLTNADGQPAAGKVIASGITDKNTGTTKITLNLTEGLDKYAVRVGNPSFGSLDYWFFNQLTLTCGDAKDFTTNLSAVKMTIYDAYGGLQKNAKLTISTQKLDAAYSPLAGKNIGGLTTGASGEVIFYLPAKERVVGEKFDYYLVEARNDKGVKFIYNNLLPEDQRLTEVDFRFSDLLIWLKDSLSGAALPNTKIGVYERAAGKLAAYEPGKQLTVLKSDNSGRIYWQYPAGFYILQYIKPSGQKMNQIVELIGSQRQELTWMIEGYNQGRCDIKSTLALTFRDFNNQLVGNLNWQLNELDLNADGQPLVLAKVGQGQLKGGSAKSSLTPQPAKYYGLQVCDKSSKFGCFWFPFVNFQCQKDLTFREVLKSVDLILRDGRAKPLVGTKFKIYVRTTDVDGRTVIDKSKLVGSWTMPVAGKFRIYLDNRELSGAPLDYTLVVEAPRRELTADFSVADEAATILEYTVTDRLTPYRPAAATAPGAAAANNLRGRILLQVESRGEAWYVNPANGARYFLGRPADAFQVMKNLSAGASNAQLAKIKPNVEIVSATDVDSDNDGLADVLEKGLGTNWQVKDSDADGYDDSQEVKSGYNPAGAGRLALDNNFAASQAGKILIQVEGRGEAWYVSPVNNERYYLSRPADAFAIMRALGLGITNADLEKIAVGQ